MANRLSSFFKQTKISNSFIAFAGVLIVFMLLMPVSGAVLDFLMIVNIAISIIIFLQKKFMKTKVLETLQMPGLTETIINGVRCVLTASLKTL